jgi:hypothetical protein
MRHRFLREKPMLEKTTDANQRSSLYDESLQNAGNNELSLSQLFPYNLQDVFIGRTDCSQIRKQIR